MTIEHLEQISGYTAAPLSRVADRSGIRRSTRLMAQAIRASRRHATNAPATPAPERSTPAS